MAFAKKQKLNMNLHIMEEQTIVKHVLSNNKN
jgi:hypothetical protein